MYDAFTPYEEVFQEACSTFSKVGSGHESRKLRPHV